MARIRKAIKSVAKGVRAAAMRLGRIAHAPGFVPGPKIAVGTHIGPIDWVDSGVWVDVSSSWVKGIRYDKTEKALFVEYKNRTGTPTVVCRYGNIQPAKAKSMFLSGSMGKWVHANIIKQSYTIVSK